MPYVPQVVIEAAQAEFADAVSRGHNHADAVELAVATAFEVAEEEIAITAQRRAAVFGDPQFDMSDPGRDALDPSHIPTRSEVRIR